MNTIEKILVAGLVVLGLFIGCFFYATTGKLGATVNYSNSGGSINLYTSLASIFTDVTSVKNSSVGVNSTTTSALGFSTLGQVGATTSTASTTITLTGAAMGDSLRWTQSTTTASVVISMQVTAANTVQIMAQNLVAAATLPATTTYTIYDISSGNLSGAQTLTTATSTSN